MGKGHCSARNACVLSSSSAGASEQIGHLGQIMHVSVLSQMCTPSAHSLHTLKVLDTSSKHLPLLQAQIISMQGKYTQRCVCVQGQEFEAVFGSGNATGGPGPAAQHGMRPQSTQAKAAQDGPGHSSARQA